MALTSSCIQEGGRRQAKLQETECHLTAEPILCMADGEVLAADANSLQVINS